MLHSRASAWLGRERVAVPLFFALLLFIGLLGIRSVPISTDEPIMNVLAREATGYVAGENDWPEAAERRYHGPLIEMAIYWVQYKIFEVSMEAGTGPLTIADLAVIRHAVTYLTFLLGVAGFYFLCKRRFRAWPVALLGALLLVLSPRVFGQSFIDSRDIPHLALFTLAVVAFLRFLECKTVVRAVIFAMLSAADIAVRSLGLFLPLLAGIVLLVEALRAEHPGATLRENARFYGIALAALAAFTYGFWPLLWRQPLLNLLDALHYAASFPGGGYYFGAVITPAPWHYVLVSFLVTTPVIYTPLFCCGLPRYARSLLERSVSSDRLQRLTVLLWFTLPLLQVTVLSGVYNGWRHILFVYPAFLLIALDGLDACITYFARWDSSRLRPLIVAPALFGLWLATVAGRMWAVHPLEYLTFSLPAGAVQGRFELDYWGLSTRVAIQRIFDRDPRPQLVIRASNNIAYENARTFFPDRVILKAESGSAVDYAIDTSNDLSYDPATDGLTQLDTIRVGGVRVAEIYGKASLK
jgi:hypothetical protein